MVQKYTNAVLSVLTSNNVPAKDISVLHQSLKEVPVFCLVSWEFSHDTEKFTVNGVNNKQENHFANAQEFDKAVKAYQLNAMHNRSYHEAFIDGAIEEKESLFKNPARRELGRIATISVHGNCRACDGTAKHLCSACFGTGVRNCFNCNGMGRQSDGSNCYSCYGGKVSCGVCSRQGYTLCDACNHTGKSTTVAKIDLVATRKLNIETNSEVLDHYLRKSLEISDYPAMMEFVSQRRISGDSYQQLFMFKAHVLTLQLQVCNKSYLMQILVRNSFWEVMNKTCFIFDDLLRSVLNEMTGLVSQLGKAGPKTLAGCRTYRLQCDNNDSLSEPL